MSIGKTWTQHFGVTLVALSLVVLGGCAAKSNVRGTVPSDAAAASDIAPQKYGNQDARPYPSFKSVEEARGHVGFTPRVPKAGVGQLRQVVVRDRDLGKDLAPEMRAIDLHYDSVEIAEAPFDDASAAEQYMEMIRSDPDAPRYVKEVKVGGRAALAWNPVDLPYEGNVNGVERPGIKIAESTVIWADGRVIYRLASREYDYAKLLMIAQSMSE